MATQELPWWCREHLRMIQPNLREVDADLDVSALVEQLERFSANAVLLNTGGVCAFYPTELEYHPRAEPLADRSDSDLTGTALEQCRSAGIRFVARFDFSKFHESIFVDRPSWAYRDVNGEHVNYDGVVHACINGEYQQEYAFEILEEALSRYPVDGVFFNMFGFVESDYDGTYYGPCHCERCRTRFRAFTDGNAELPPPGYDNADHPAYRQFKQQAANELLDRVRAQVKGIADRRPEDTDSIGVATYSERRTHAVTDESNTAVDRPLPRWQYSAVDNVAAIEDSWSKPAWNIVINAVDIPYRFQGVSTPEIRSRLFGALLRGGGLAYCVNGDVAAYPDPSNFPAVETAYGIAAANEDVYRTLEPLAEVALVRPADWAARPEYRGWFRRLAEAHVPFHVRTEESLGREKAAPLVDTGDSQYDVLILPDLRLADTASRRALVRAHEAGTTILATGPRTADTAPKFLESTFAARREHILEDVRGAYVDAESIDPAFEGLAGTDLVAVDHDFAVTSPMENGGIETGFPFVTPGTFGPPERVGREGLDRTETPGLLSRPGPDGSVYLPWGPGRLYHEHGFDTHAAVLDGACSLARPALPLVETDAPPTVEIGLGEHAGGRLLQLLNRGGFTGTTYHDPPPIHDLSIRLRVPMEGADILARDEPGDETRAQPQVSLTGDELSLSRLGTYVAIALT